MCLGFKAHCEFGSLGEAPFRLNFDWQQQWSLEIPHETKTKTKIEIVTKSTEEIKQKLRMRDEGLSKSFQLHDMKKKNYPLSLFTCVYVRRHPSACLNGISFFCVAFYAVVSIVQQDSFFAISLWHGESTEMLYGHFSCAHFERVKFKCNWKMWQKYLKYFLFDAIEFEFVKNASRALHCSMLLFTIYISIGSMSLRPMNCVDIIGYALRYTENLNCNLIILFCTVTAQEQHTRIKHHTWADEKYKQRKKTSGETSIWQTVE